MKVQIEISGKRKQANLLAGMLDDFLKKELTDTESYPEQTTYVVKVMHTVLRGRSESRMREDEQGRAG